MFFSQVWLYNLYSPDWQYFFPSDNLTNLWRCVHAALSLCPPPRTSPYLPPRQTPPRHPAPSPPFPPWPLSFSHNRTSPGSSTGPRTPSFLQVTPYPLYHHADLSTTSGHSPVLSAGAPRPVKLSLQPADCWLQGKIHPLVIHHFTLL